MAHFGPYQAYLVYRELARHFDHDAVIVSVLPTNDFRDIDYAAALELGWYEFRYRPYLVGEAPSYEHVDHREPGWQRWLRHHSYAFNGVRQALRNRALRASRAPTSRFYDFSQRQLRLLETILERLAVAADGKPILLLLIPTAADLRRTQGYFHDCDIHWNALGNTLATEALLRRLGPDFYSFDRVTQPIGRIQPTLRTDRARTGKRAVRGSDRSAAARGPKPRAGRRPRRQPLCGKRPGGLSATRGRHARPRHEATEILGEIGS
jgi:hypothetical protein